MGYGSSLKKAGKITINFVSVIIQEIGGFLNMVSHSPDTDLSKVRSFEKQQELFNILHSEEACHYERLYLVGFLKFVGYSLEEICALIDKEASWGDYDATMTYCQIHSIFKPGVKASPEEQHISSQVVSFAPFLYYNKEKVSSPGGVYPSGSKLCIVGPTRITCYFKDCDLCNFKSPAGCDEK